MHLRQGRPHQACHEPYNVVNFVVRLGIGHGPSYSIGTADLCQGRQLRLRPVDLRASPQNCPIFAVGTKLIKKLIALPLMFLHRLSYSFIESI